MTQTTYRNFTLQGSKVASIFALRLSSLDMVMIPFSSLITTPHQSSISLDYDLLTFFGVLYTLTLHLFHLYFSVS